MPEGIANPPSADIAIDDAGRLIGDLSCLKCGYNLRTLHRDAACPECGTAVGRSIEGNRLRYCDPWWLKQIWEGLNCFGVAAVSAIGFVAFVMLLDSPNDDYLIIGAALLATALALAIYGFFKATRRDPARIDPERLFSARRLARGAWLGASMMIVVLMMVATSGSALMADRLAVIFLGLLYTGPVFLLIHAAGLAARLPNDRLMLAVWGVNAYLVLVGALATVASIEPLWDWLGAHYGYAVVEWKYRIGTSLPYMMLLLAVLLTVLLVWYWWALSRAAGYAWATWARRE